MVVVLKIRGEWRFKRYCKLGKTSWRADKNCWAQRFPEACEHLSKFLLTMAVENEEVKTFSKHWLSKMGINERKEDCSLSLEDDCWPEFIESDMLEPIEQILENADDN